MSDALHIQSQVFVGLDSAYAPEDLLLDLLEVSVESSLHLPDVAVLVLHDPQLRWADDPRLDPGKKLEVRARAGAREDLLFDGEIVELEPELRPGAHRLTVRAFDRLHRLSYIRKVRAFHNVSDADLVRKLAAEAGLEAKVGPASLVYPYVAQMNETNLAFLQHRAAALGYLLFVEGSTLCCVPPEAGPALELDWSAGLREFRPRLTTAGQVGQVTVRGWDPANRREIVGQAREGQGSPEVGERRRGGELARDAFQVDVEQLVADRPVRDQRLAEQLAQAVADRAQERLIEAEGVCGGNPALTAGVTLRLSGMGKRFSGAYFVTGATHRYSAADGYSTEFSVSGQRPLSLLSLLRPPRESPPPGTLLIGVVTDNQDPEGMGRVKVKFPWLAPQHASDWARVVAAGGGNERGLLFLPEIDDEVLVGFEMGDLHHPYILGGLWNGHDKPPLTGDDLVQGGKIRRRVIRSRTGHQIVFDDSSGEEQIQIEDGKGNSIKLDSAARSLALKADGDIQIEAGGRLKLLGKGGVDLDGSQATVDVKGTTINLN